MGNMIAAFTKGFHQLSDKKTQSVVWTSVGLSLAVLIGSWIVIGKLLLETTLITYIPFADTVIDVLGFLATGVLTWFLFPVIVTFAGSFFLEKVADAVEERHYPHLNPAPGIPFEKTIGPSLKFLGVSVGFNLLALPLILTPFYPFIYYALNGYLLSREYFEVVAHRRMAPKDALQLRNRHQKTIFMAGVGIAFLLTIPVLNLVMPVVATAALVHLFERWRPADTNAVIET